MTRRITGLSEIVDAFDAALIDQFGVLHDGARAFPGARSCLDELAMHGKPMIALTNSGKRAAENSARLIRLGFPESLFLSVISSGELAHAHLAAELHAGGLREGAGVAVISRGGDLSVVKDLPLRAVGPEEDPAILLIAGAEPERHSRDAYRALTAPLAARGVPAICANPDTTMYTDSGPAFGAGAIAADYEAMGGRIRYFGKPAPAMFETALARLDRPAGRVLMIGDSAEHDVAGAKRAGCLALHILGGVQSKPGRAGPPPDFAAPRLLWSAP